MLQQRYCKTRLQQHRIKDHRLTFIWLSRPSYCQGVAMNCWKWFVKIQCSDNHIYISRSDQNRHHLHVKWKHCSEPECQHIFMYFRLGNRGWCNYIKSLVAMLLDWVLVKSIYWTYTGVSPCQIVVYRLDPTGLKSIRVQTQDPLGNGSDLICFNPEQHINVNFLIPLYAVRECYTHTPV